MKYLEKMVSIKDKNYLVRMLPCGDTRYFVKSGDAWRTLYTAPVIARINAALADEAHTEALEINAAMCAVTPAQSKAADIVADVKRRAALYGFAGQEVKFTVIDLPGRFGVHFQTMGGEDISGYGHFADTAEMYLVIDELNRILAVKPANEGKTRIVFERQPETACAIRQHDGAFFSPVWRLNSDVMDIERIPEGSKPVLRKAAEIKNGVALIPVCKLGAAIDIQIPDELYIVYEEAL